MANKKISDLTLANTVQDTDLFEVSKDNLDGTYVSSSITGQTLKASAQIDSYKSIIPLATTGAFTWVAETLTLIHSKNKNVTLYKIMDLNSGEQYMVNETARTANSISFDFSGLKDSMSNAVEITMMFA